MSSSAASSQSAPSQNSQPSQPAAAPSTKEFSQFLSALSDYSPTYPENLTRYCLERSGFAVKDDRVAKLVSLAADKVMSRIVYEAKQVANLRIQGAKATKRKSDRSADSIEVEDLEACLSQYRIYVRKNKKRKTSDGSVPVVNLTAEK